MPRPKKTPQPLKRNRKKQMLPEAIEAGLTDKELEFCRLYTNTNEYRGNGVQAYGKAFGLDLSDFRKYNVAKNNACRLLTKVEVLNHIQKIFADTGMNEATVQTQHAFLMAQNSDFGSKLGAVRLWYEINNKLKKAPDNAIQFNINIESATGTNN